MKLIDLDPAFVDIARTRDSGPSGLFGGPPIARVGIGMTFRCPCGCADRVFVPFTNPIDGGPPLEAKGWAREGGTFETLTVRPSIERVYPTCGWHGLITNGEVTSC